MKKEFYKKCQEIHQQHEYLQTQADGSDGKTVDFGYLTKRGDEYFTVVDWGNIWKWITKNLLDGHEIQKLIALERYKAVAQELDKLAVDCPHEDCNDGYYLDLLRDEINPNTITASNSTKCEFCHKVKNSRFNITKRLTELQVKAFGRKGALECTIIVSVEGGGVVDVDNIPHDIVVEVRDFDDEEFDATGFKDDAGNWYSKKLFKEERK